MKISKLNIEINTTYSF